MARRATSLSSPICILTAALLAFAAAFLLVAPHQARADAGVKKNGVCRYDSPDAIAAFKKGDYRQAAELFTKAIDWIEQNCEGKGSSQVDLLDNSKSGLWDAYKFRAASYTGLKDYGKAVHDLVTMDRATVLGMSKNELKTAFLAYDGAVKSDPNNPFYLGARAAAYQKWAPLVALEANDKKLEATYLKAALADRNAQVKHARTNKERAEALAGRSFLYYSAKYKFGPDDSQHALEDISAAIELDPRGEYYFHRSGLQKDSNLALSDVSKAIELKPDNAWWYATRAHIRQKLNQPQAAIDDLSAALAKTSPHNHNYPDYLSERAELFKETGKLDAAEKDYAEFIKYSPKSVSRRTDHLGILMALGRDKDAEIERKIIERIDPKALQKPSFVCQVADMRAKQADKGGAATPKDLTTAWTLGKLVALIPLQYLKGKADEKADEAWATVSNVVAAREKATGKEPHGLDPIPEFKGPKIAQVKQTIAFFFQQRKKVEAVLTAEVGNRAGAVFAVSSAGFMALGLNAMGVPNLNNQLGEIIEKEAPLSGLPCNIWVDTAIKATSHAKPADVVAAWDKASKEAKTFLSKS